ncbi:MAG: hypothetical protein U0132_05935 [Gemmatimonadaceae bacterium]
MTPIRMTCTEFDDRLADLLEGTLDVATQEAMTAHRVSCLRCAALVRDLEKIQREASSLPELAPSNDLWAGIAARLDQDVVVAPAFGGVRRANEPRRRFMVPPRFVQWSVAAAALITISSSVTYFATRSRFQQNGVDSARVATATVNSDASREQTPAGTPSPEGSPSGVVNPVQPVANSATRVRVPVKVTYDREITDLRQILDQRRSDLDPATVAVIEHSLTTIDQAIAEARKALATDPASKFLSEQLNKALEKKLGLLRTVALLPSRA